MGETIGAIIPDRPRLISPEDYFHIISSGLERNRLFIVIINIENKISYIVNIEI